MIPDEVDVIVCGGGSTGCCVAGRLARASPDLQVLIVEAGANNNNDSWVYRVSEVRALKRQLDLC